MAKKREIILFFANNCKGRFSCNLTCLIAANEDIDKKSSKSSCKEPIMKNTMHRFQNFLHQATHFLISFYKLSETFSYKFQH